ncbi:MAG: hypothetical protein GXY43_06760 [Clostridiaceae bacterium]|nr:hypothetical protein [Clostridiaceae bacterium]
MIHLALACEIFLSRRNPTESQAVANGRKCVVKCGGGASDGEVWASPGQSESAAMRRNRNIQFFRDDRAVRTLDHVTA